MGRPKLTPEIAYNLAAALYRASGERDERLESVIAKEAQFAYQYARLVLKAPWPEAEPIIVQEPRPACFYATYVLKAPWPEAEPVIVQNPKYAMWYADHVLKTPEDIARFDEIWRQRY
jgi:hypothetical protein